MKKILASLLAITMLMTTLSACIIPASAAENPVLTEGFTEDFENYGTGNWLANMTTDSDLVDSTKISNMGASDWTVYGGYYATEQYTPEKLIEKGVSVGVVADPDNADNQVLKIDVGDFEEKEWIRVRRNSNDGSAIKRADLPKGKKMVIKAKFKLPTEFTGSANTVLFTYDRQSKQIKKWMNENMSGNYNGKKWTVLATDAISYGSNLQSGAETTVKTGEWFDLKYIVDITDHKTEDHPADTYRAFYDGSIYTHYLPDFSKVTGTIRDLNKKFPQPSTTAGVLGGKIVESFGGYINPPEGTTYRDFGSFYGASMTVAGSGKAGDYMYMDDIEVYYIDPFKQEDGATFEKVNSEGIWYEGEIRIPFNNNLMTVVKENSTQLDYKTLFTLKDAEDKVVEGGIAGAKAEGKELVIELDKSIPRNTSYTISADPLFMDEEGQGLNQFSKTQDLLTFDTADDPFAHIYIDEDFENYTDLTSNWAKNRDSEGYVLTSVGVEEKAWMIGGRNNSDLSKGGTVKIVKDPKNSGRGNVLMIDSSDIKDSGQNITLVKKPVDNGFVQRSKMDNKRIVIQADIYIPTSTEGYNLTEDTVFAYYNGKAGMNTRYPNANILPYNSMGTSPFVIGSGEGSNIYAATRAKYGASGAWHTFKYVIDVSAQPSTTRVDTVRGYMDGVLMASPLGEGSGTEYSTLSTYPLTEDDGTTPRVIVDYWKRATNVFGNPTTNGSVGDFFGIFMANRPKNSDGGSAYYIDNMKSYYINDLTMTAPDLSNYTGGAIRLDFNNELPENFAYMVSPRAGGGTMTAPTSPQTLKDVITLKDSNGNVIENGLNIKLSSDKKSVVIVPNVESNKNYKIVISRFFRDAEGQGLTKNSTDTVLDLKVGDFVPFAFKGLSQNSVSGFMQGRDVKVTAEFSMNIDETMVTEGIVVKNADTEEVIPYGAWTYSYATDENDEIDYKKIVLDFTNLPTANYIVTTDADFAIGEEALEEAFVLEINQAAKPIVLFSETFDGTGKDAYTVNENWITAGVSAGSELESGAISYRDNDWNIVGADAANGDFAGVVNINSEAVPAEKFGSGFSGNALKLSNTRGTSYRQNAFKIRKNLDKLNGISLTTGEYAGKLLVVEMDMMAVRPASGSNLESVFMAPSYNKKTIERPTTANESLIPMLMADSRVRITQFGYQASSDADYPWSADVYTTASKYFTSGHKFKVVLDQSSEKHHYRMYADNVMARATKGEGVSVRLPGHAYAEEEIYDIGGVKYNGKEYHLPDTLYGLWSSVNRADIYIDNFTAYLVDPFEIESVEGAGDAFNSEKGAITYTFTQPVDESKIEENVVLIGENGKEVAGGIKSAVASDAGYKLTVKLSEKLAGNAKYTIRLDNALTDIYGNCISPKYRWYTYTPAADSGVIKNADGTATYTLSGKELTTNADCYLKDYSADGMKMMIDITTSKANSLYAEAEEATVNGTTVTTNVVFTNPEIEDMEVLCFIAVYGKYNEMIGCHTIKEIIPAGKKIDNIPVSITTRKSDIGFVKMYVWNNETEMDPYHNAEILYK